MFDKKVQERMLRKSDLKLADAMDFCRAAESSQNQLAEIRKQDAATVNEMKSSAGSSASKSGKCYECGDIGHFARDCPKKDDQERQCYNCKGFGHMSRDCPSGDSYPRRKRKKTYRGRGRGVNRGGTRREVHEMDDNGFDEYVQEFSTLSLCALRVSSLIDHSRKRFVTFRFHDLELKRSNIAELKVDSGAEANVMTLQKYKELFPERVDADGVPTKKYLQKSKRKLEAYGGVEVHHFGTVNIPCQYGDKKFMCRFFLCDNAGSMLLGLPTCEALGIVKINVIDEVSENPVEVSSAEENGKKRESVDKSQELYIDPIMPIAERPTINSKEDLRRMYPECFKQEGKHFKNFEYDIKIDPTVEPKIHPPRRVPMELKDKLKLKLDEMERKGVIVKVPEPTRWVNSLVIETKANGDFRVCLDPTDLNKAVLREYHPIPVVEDIVPELGGSDLFTKLDLKDGYWHIKLTKESSYLTTFSTPYGKYRYERLPFGLRVSQDIFQYKVDETYGSCEGTIGISDDITCHGKGDKEHDRRLHATMEQTRKANLCLNYEKLIVKQRSVKFFGNIYSAEGVSADPDKIKAITAMRPPETKNEVKSFLGMVNYLQKFIPRLSEYTKLLRSLEGKGVLFVWNAEHQESFEKIKELVSENMLLAYYDRRKPVTVQCDYSENGLGVALVQEGKPVQFASKALVEGEEQYAPIEGEMLGVVFGIKKFHHYLYGRKFNVECDHKPLQHIRQKNLTLAPPRLRGMLRSVADYDFTLLYRPGKEMVLPDALSRLSQADKTEVKGTHVRIHELIDVSQSRLEKLQRETEADEVLQKIKKLVKSGWPKRRRSLELVIRPYWGMRNDISIVDDLLMAGSRIIIPQSSRSQVLQEIHEGHQGETRCLLRAKMAVYWPGMYKEIQETVGKCGACREFENAQTKCPMVAVEVPSQPWHTVGADLFQYKGRWFILLTDMYSKAPFVRPLANTGAYATVKAMKSIFAENGIPIKMISDNGTHFTAGEFKQFAARWGFEMILSSPEYPQGHALIERHIQTIKKCMHKCDVSGYDLDLALLVLRSTPLGSDMPSPAELLQQRRFRTTLPTYVPDPPMSQVISQKLKERQNAAAAHYNKTAKAKTELVEGQPVRLYNKSNRRWEPAIVTGRASTPRSYHVQRMTGGVPLRRNRVHLRTTRENFDANQFIRSDGKEEEEIGTSVQTTNTADKNNVETPLVPVNSTNNEDTSVPTAPIIRRSDRVRRQTQFYQADG